jgi:WD40 repeat protein
MVRLWDAARGGPHGLPLVGHDATIEDLAFSPDARYLVSGDDRRVAILWDLGLHAPRRRLVGHASRIWGVAFSPDSRLLATAGGDGLRLWDAENGTTRVQLGREGFNRFCAVAFSPDGRFLASGGDDRAVTLWDASVWAGPDAAPLAPR